MGRPKRQVAVRIEHKAFLRDLGTFCRFPSISSDPRCVQNMLACAAWLAARLRGAGLSAVRVERTTGHPVVVGQSPHRPGRPGVLLYGHYDVQPVAPRAAWRSPPFEPRLRGEEMVARGASDDKGQLLVQVHALEALLRHRGGTLPVNVTCIYEGEEEIGSPSMRRWLHRHRRSLAEKVAIVSNTRMLGADQPALTVSLRGSVTAELVVRGSPKDLHSGAFGGAIHNPVHALADIVSSLHDTSGRVAATGFYEDVRSLGSLERIGLRGDGPTDTELRKAAGGTPLWGEPYYTGYERTTIRPALTVTGVSGGYEGPGMRNAIPQAARARLNIRLVPDQNPARVAELVAHHVATVTPPTVRADFRLFTLSWPAETSAEHPAALAALGALERVWGSRPVVLRSGGTIPAVAVMQEELGIAPVLIGFALPDDNMHAPNEKVHLPTLFRGVEAMTTLLATLG